MTRKLLAILAGLVLCTLIVGCDSGEPGEDEMLQRRPVKEPRPAPSVPTVDMSKSDEGEGTPPPKPE